MSTEFDPDTGLLRIGHAALSVLGRLAVAPTDPSLVDHATAPPLATLRAAGILGPGGIDRAVRPLAEVIGAPLGRLQLVLEEGGAVQRCVGWVTDELVVLGVRAPISDEAYDLMAERPAEAPGLIGDLVGLVSGPPMAEAEADRVVVDAEGLDLLLRGAAAATADDPVPGIAPTPLAALAGAVRVRWRLVVSLADSAPVGVLEVIDAGGAGLWELEPTGPIGAGQTALRQTDPMAVRRRVGALLTAALGRR